jgi:hypothetical protein
LGELRIAGFEQAHELMVAVGDLLDLPEVIEFESQTRWEVTTADGQIVDVTYDEATDKLVLESVVGQPASGARERMYEAMLIYNGSWRETGGARLTLDEPGGTTTLLFDISASSSATCSRSRACGGTICSATREARARKACNPSCSRTSSEAEFEEAAP